MTLLGFSFVEYPTLGSLSSGIPYHRSLEDALFGQNPKLQDIVPDTIQIYRLNEKAYGQVFSSP